MTRMLDHRGPDDFGVMISEDGVCALGNTRLAITDPGAKLDLPMRSSDGRASLTFNGEIYNYREARAGLEARGIRFRHHTDTEVLLEGLHLHGEEFLYELDGMWAFAYYNHAERSLLLGRDVLGERHIFYRIHNEELVFASEPRPILADAGATAAVDFTSLVSSLCYYSAPPGKTLVQGLGRMLPGRNMRAAVGEEVREYAFRRLHPEKWFDFFGSEPTEEKLISAFEEVLSRASLRRIPPDVPFIATLSGGIDSTLVCAFASDFGRIPLRTLYGQGADEAAQNLPEDLNEWEASKLTSTRLGSRHIRIQLNEEDAVPVLLQLASNAFDGYVEGGSAAFSMLARQTRREALKVMLISDGPDELAGGYHIDRRAYQFDKRSRSISGKLRTLLSGSILSREGLRRAGLAHWIVPPHVSYRPFHFEVVHQTGSVDSLWRIADIPSIRDGLHAYGGSPEETYADIIPELDWTQLRALSYAAYSLPDMFNLRTDKAFLGSAVECRLPLQAPEVAEFLIALPAKWRFGDGGQTKHLLRKVVERRIGKEIAYRSKHGFSAPLYGTPRIRNQLRMTETIQDSALFRDLPFKKNARERVAGTQSLHWRFFALAKTYEQLRTGDFSASAALSAVQP